MMVSCENCQFGRKTSAGYYCGRLQRVVNLYGCRYHSPIQRERKQTNADKIRAMTDEELAEWVRQYGDCILTHCCACDICVPTMEDMSCKDWILKWLKQEVTE